MCRAWQTKSWLTGLNAWLFTSLNSLTGQSHFSTHGWWGALFWPINRQRGRLRLHLCTNRPSPIYKTACCIFISCLHRLLKIFGGLNYLLVGGGYFICNKYNSLCLPKWTWPMNSDLDPTSAFDGWMKETASGSFVWQTASCGRWLNCRSH